MKRLTAVLLLTHHRSSWDFPINQSRDMLEGIGTTRRQLPEQRESEIADIRISE
jgi:hypothetical protein